MKGKDTLIVTSLLTILMGLILLLIFSGLRSTGSWLVLGVFGFILLLNILGVIFFGIEVE